MKELDDVGFITSEMPDLSIVYKLHLQSGALVNLYDWMRAFHAVVTSQDLVEGGEGEEISELTQLVLFFLIWMRCL